MHNFVDIAAPLTRVMLSKHVWEWGPEQERAFKKFLELLCSPPVLKLPGLQQRFIVDTNNYVNATGAVLLQEYDDGCILLHFSCQSITPPRITMVLAIKSCLLLYRSVQNGIATSKDCLP